MISRIEKTVLLVEKALKELIAEGRKVNQYAIEKRAGLSNGALNYNTKAYHKLKDKIRIIKEEAEPKKKNARQTAFDKENLANALRLKEKYYKQKNLYREKLRYSEARRLELQFQLFHIQQYIMHLEEKGYAELNVVSFNINKAKKNNL